MISVTQQLDEYALVAAVRDYALKHYNDAGVRWDIIVEAYEDGDILEAIGDATTLEVALRRVRKGLGSVSTKAKAQELKLDLQGTYINGDQPTTCPIDGSRTDIEDLPDGTQVHTCLAQGHRFLTADEDDEDMDPDALDDDSDACDGTDDSPDDE